MAEILQKFSLLDIIIYASLFFVIVKKAIDYYQWAKKNTDAAYASSYNNKEKERNVHDAITRQAADIKSLEANQKSLSTAIENLSSKIDDLIQSDQEDIKAFLTREHHYFCYKQGWIDDYSLECCEKRFSRYAARKGNSFIEGFMLEIRALPKQPPNYKK